MAQRDLADPDMASRPQCKPVCPSPFPAQPGNETTIAVPPATAGSSHISSPVLVVSSSHPSPPAPFPVTEGQCDIIPQETALLATSTAAGAQPSRRFVVSSSIDQFATTSPVRSRDESHDLDSSLCSSEYTASLTLQPALSNHGARLTCHPASLDDMPNEVLFHIFGYLEVPDLLATSRTSHQLRDISVAPILHALRLRHARAILPPLLTNPTRPSLADLIARHIFLTHNTVVSRKLGRSLTAIRLSHRLAARPSPESLVERCVLPKECAPGIGHVSPALVAKKRAIEKERVKDSLRRWVGGVWKGEVRERSEGVKRWEERVGVGRVWRLRRFWERIGRGEVSAPQSTGPAVA